MHLMNERRILTMPYSEVCVHLGVAGKELIGELTDSGRMVQLYELDGEKQISFPITRGEAGWNLSHS